jgi:hypothetical protein
MMTSITAPNSNQTLAKSLLADIQASRPSSFPRRETLLDWLRAYLVRSDEKGYATEHQDGLDLIAVDQFLHSYSVPANATATA